MRNGLCYVLFVTPYVDAFGGKTRVRLLMSLIESSIIRDKNGIIQKFFLISFSEHIIY